MDYVSPSSKLDEASLMKKRDAPLADAASDAKRLKAGADDDFQHSLLMSQSSIVQRALSLKFDDIITNNKDLFQELENTQAAAAEAAGMAQAAQATQAEAPSPAKPLLPPSSLQRLPSITFGRMGSGAPQLHVLQSARSGDFLEFLSELAQEKDDTLGEDDGQTDGKLAMGVPSTSAEAVRGIFNQEGGVGAAASGEGMAPPAAVVPGGGATGLTLDVEDAFAQHSKSGEIPHVGDEGLGVQHPRMAEIARGILPSPSERAERQAPLAPPDTPGEAVGSMQADLMRPNERLFWRALETTRAPNGELLKDYFRNESRAGDILFFDKEHLPFFEREKIRREGAKGAAAKGKGALADPQADASRWVTRISDRQEKCICSLQPRLMFPIGPGALAKGGAAVGGYGKRWKIMQLKCQPCGNTRNSREEKRMLENYKFTGFCLDHIQGTGQGSRPSWFKHQKLSVRGFNLSRNANDRRMRHILCLEAPTGLVFLKWCTQCHLWKNLASFAKGGDAAEGAEGELEVHTFCAVCHRRQVNSRDKRRYERAKKRKIAQFERMCTKYKDVDLDDLAEKLDLKRSHSLDLHVLKVLSLDSTRTKFMKFTRTVFENATGGACVLCGAFAGVAEDMIVMKALEVMIELHLDPRADFVSKFGEGKWMYVLQELLAEVDLKQEEPPELVRQSSLDYWVRPSRREIFTRFLTELLHDSEIRYRIMLLGTLLIESRMKTILGCEVSLQAMYEGCILVAFLVDMPATPLGLRAAAAGVPGAGPEAFPISSGSDQASPKAVGEGEGEPRAEMFMTETQLADLQRMGWRYLHLMAAKGLMLLVDESKTNEELELIEMLGVKRPSDQLLQSPNPPELLIYLYPEVHQCVFRNDLKHVAALAQAAQTRPPEDESKSDAIDWQGCTPLHHAVLHTLSEVDEMIELLLFSGVDVTKANKRGLSPLDVAALGNPVVLGRIVDVVLNPSVLVPEGKVVLSPGEAKRALEGLVATCRGAIDHVSSGLITSNAKRSLALLQTKMSPT